MIIKIFRTETDGKCLSILKEPTSILELFCNKKDSVIAHDFYYVRKLRQRKTNYSKTLCPVTLNYLDSVNFVRGLEKWIDVLVILIYLLILAYIYIEFFYEMQFL